MVLFQRLAALSTWLAPAMPDMAKPGQRRFSLACWAGLCLLNAAGPVLAATDSMASARQQMVELQLKAPDRHITHAGVLKAMGEIPRHEFVPEAQRALAYADRPLSIGYGQTISQPYVVAFMTEQLDPGSTDNVLEIGTGSGYQAAVLSPLVKTVYSIEIIEALGLRARAELQRLGYDNVQVRIGDGYQGWPEAAPFDSIIVTCAPDRIPPPLIEQLKEGGRLVIPVGPGLEQTLYLFTKRAGILERRAVLPVRFVPMTGEAQRR
jgi:protein-L-isoaspartate(D-aspartate) O-methyltransferase